MPRPVHFEVTADDPERAAKFYREVFDWTVNKWDGPQPYWLIGTGDRSEPGIDGGIVEREGMEMPNCTTIGVPSVDEYVAKIEAAGGKIVVPKMEIPGVGFLAYFTDTENNWFGIMQRLQ